MPAYDKWGGNWPYTALVAERNRQEMKWGFQDHDPQKWMSILMEEVGEVAKAINENDPANYEEELVQVGALVVAMLENHQWRGRSFDLPDRQSAES